MKHIFIVNPNSAKGKSIEIANEIDKIGKEYGLKYRIIYTTKPKEATDIAKIFAQEGNTVIYSVGGDGTLFEVVNGMATGKALLSVVPAGSGNDFYRSIKNFNTSFTSVDVGKLNEYYFINNASIGLDAEIASNVDKMKQMSLPPSMIYNASILYTYLKYYPYEVTHDLEKKLKKEKITLCTICNGNYYGGGFKIAPKASLTDGKFDVYLADNMSKLKIPPLLLKLTKGEHESSPLITRYQKEEVNITSEVPLICNLDGEIIRETDFNFKLLEEQVTLYTHPKIKRFIKEKLTK